MERIDYLKVFYVTHPAVDFRHIMRLSNQVRYRLVPNCLYGFYHANNRWGWSRLTKREVERLEPAQQERIGEFESVAVYAIEHQVHAWPELLPLLKRALARYGGWVGREDDSFERVYTAEDIEQLEHPFGDGFRRASPRPASRPGERIELDPALLQPDDVFDLETYRTFMRRARYLSEEKKRLLAIVHAHVQEQSIYPDRPEPPESKQYDVVWDQFDRMKTAYGPRLPIHLIAQCPYCGAHILQPFDSLSLMGFDGNLKATRAYGGGKPQWQYSLPAQRCKHALCATLAVSLNGQQPERTMGGMLGRSVLMRCAPYVMVWPLIARYTSAVMHALPIGRLDDAEPAHRYTAYMVTYFVGEGSNLYEQMWVPTEFRGPATDGVQVDIDLLKWVRAGRLYWLDREDTSRLVKGPAEAFPYADVEPKGWYYIRPGGQMDGPHPYYQIWQGQAPPHDESFPRSIE